MYNLGMDEDDTLLQQQHFAQQVGLEDEEEPSPRGEDHTPFVQLVTSHLLRIGFTLQTGALFFMFIFYTAFGGTGLFVFDLYAGPEFVRISKPFHLTISILTGIYLIGTVYIALYQVFVADNSKWCRGFRAGSKMLAAAVTLDFVSTSLRLVQYLYAYFFMGMKWWARYNQTKADWALFNFGNVVNSLALLMYGLAFFYMESYHDEGTAEEFGWALVILFGLASFSELLMVFTNVGAFFTIFLLAAMATATVWAFAFEPLVEKWSPDLHSREVNADVLPQISSDSNPSGQTTEMDDMGYGHGNPSMGTAMGTTMGSTMGSAMPPPPHNAPPTGGDIPTSYDYSQLNHQVSQGVEMGVVGTDYPQ